jgi:hypothetical protein
MLKYSIMVKVWSYSFAILYLVTRCGRVVSFTLRPLYLRRGALSSHWIGCEPQSRSGRCRVKKISCVCRVLNPCRPARSLSLHRTKE